MAKKFDPTAVASLEKLIKDNSKIKWRPRRKKSNVVSYHFNFPKTLTDKALVEVVVSYGNKKITRKKERIWFGLEFIKREKYREQEPVDEKAEAERVLSLRQFVAEASGDRLTNQPAERVKTKSRSVPATRNGKTGPQPSKLPVGRKPVPVQKGRKAPAVRRASADKVATTPATKGKVKPKATPKPRQTKKTS